MANPQIENGSTSVANELLEAVCRTSLSPHESRVFWAIVRKTYGWHKKVEKIRAMQLPLITNMEKPHISRTLKKLIARSIVTRTGNKLSIQKDYTLWIKDQSPISALNYREESGINFKAKVTRTGNFNENEDVTHTGNKKLPVQETTVTRAGNKKLPVQATFDIDLGRDESPGKNLNKRNKLNKIKEIKKENNKRKKNPFPNVYDVTPDVLQGIADKYHVPFEFVLSKWDDAVNWYEERPDHSSRKGRNWKATIMNWVKKDAQKIISSAKAQQQNANKYAVQKLGQNR